MKVSAKDRGAIVALHEQGICMVEIARRLTISKPTVARWIKRYEETGETANKHRTGRPRCTTSEEDEAIVRVVEENPFSSTGDIHRILDLQCSNRTIRNRLHDQQLNSRAPGKKPLLTEDNKKRRLAYARKYANKDNEL